MELKSDADREGWNMRDNYHAWLEDQPLAPNTIQTQFSRAAQVEKSYGDLACPFIRA